MLRYSKLETHFVLIASTLIIFLIITQFMNVSILGGNLLLTNAAENQENDIYIPLVLGNYPTNTLFGIQMERLDPDFGFEMVRDTNVSWIRHNGVLWSEVEPIEGLRLWDTMAELENEVMKASSEGIEVIMIVRSTPLWAQTIDGAYCGPIKEEDLNSFGEFLYDVVNRYSKPPYNVKYWEIWNEPDVPYTGSNATSGWGCWGDFNDDYFGGEYFGQMLSVVYPRIKQADPNATVIIGGLLLDCDPRPESNYCAAWNHSDRPPKFLEGILLNGGGTNFDVVAFHGYDYFDYTDPELGEYLNPVWGSSWNGELVDGSPGGRVGPVSIFKADYVREILARYNVTGKLLMNTEAALICGATNDPPGGSGCENVDDSLYEQTKAKYVPHAYGAAIKEGLSANTWYTILGWRNSGLIYSNLNPRPAYTSFTVARDELASAEFVQEITSFPGVKIFDFQQRNRTIWLIWSYDGTPHTVTLPSTPDEVKDYMGVVKTPSTTFTATLDPHYLIWYP